MSEHVYVILLNWNGWRDTIECAESLLDMRASDYTVVICDNASEDDSYRYLRSWALASRPCSFVEWHPGEEVTTRGDKSVVLIQTGDNLGFAGGCNVGIRYGLACNNGDYFWLLNNDTVVDPEALNAQRRKMESRPDIGILGSTLLFYSSREVVQCQGGYGFNRWNARVRPLLRSPSIADLRPEEEVESRLHYVSGASMFVRQAFVEQVGLLNEQYFLYFEEVDWITRAKGRFSLGYCAASLVYHKEGRSIGSDQDRVRRSVVSERFLTRNRLLFTKTYMPHRLPVTLLWVGMVALHDMLRGRFSRSRMMLRSIVEGLLAKSSRPSPAVHPIRTSTI